MRLPFTFVPINRTMLAPASQSFRSRIVALRQPFCAILQQGRGMRFTMLCIGCASDLQIADFPL
jgi:hypothetical protein